MIRVNIQHQWNIMTGENWRPWRKPVPVHSVHHKSHVNCPGSKPQPPRWETSD
jgi:hypothetical protein